MRKPCHVTAARGIGGFTLVELLIVLVMMSLLALAMGSALRTASQTEARVDASLQRMDDLRVVNGFLRSVLGNVSAQKSTLPVELGASPFFFVGASDSMAWVGVMPARYGVGGRYHFRLGVAQGGGLLLHYVPWAGASSPPDWASAQSVELLSGVTEFALQYQDATGEPPVWTSQWAIIDNLPNRVMLSVQTTSGAWPDIVVPLRVLPASDPRSNGPVFGGT